MMIIGNGRLVTQDNVNPYIENGAVAVEGEMIVDVGTTSMLCSKYPEAEFVDANERIIMPGLINTHTHIYSSFARGMSLEQPHPNRNFLEILKNMWWRMDKALTLEDTKYSAYATGLESLKYGVTTIFDHHASPHHITGSLRAIADATQDIGLRSVLCYEVSDRDGKDIAMEGIRENIAFIDEAARDTSDTIHGLFGLHAPFTLSPETLEKSVEAMGSRNAGYHIHVAEGIDDVQDSLKKYGKRCVNRLFDAGLLGEKSIAAHCIHIDGREMDLLCETGTAVVHNAESNMGNAVGCANILELIRRGVLLGMGTDAYTQDMFESLKVANIIHKHNLADPSIGFMETYDMLFQNNREIAARYFQKPLGILQPGAYADIILVDYIPHTPLNEHTIRGHIMFGMMGRSVDSVMIGGKFVMRDRIIESVDEKAILAKTRAQSADFWKRV